MNRFFSALLSVLAAVLMIVVLLVVGYAAYKLYRGDFDAAPAAVSNIPADDGGQPTRLGGNKYVEQPVGRDVYDGGFTPAGNTQGGGSNNCLVFPIGAGNFTAPEYTIVAVREYQGDKTWNRVQGMAKGDVLEVGGGVLPGGGNRDAWKITGCTDLTAANMKVYEIVMADWDGNIPGLVEARIQLECPALVEEARVAGLDPKDEGGLSDRENWFIVVPKEGFDMKFLQVCENGTPEAPALPAAPEAPAQPAVPSACAETVAQGTAVPAGQIVEAGRIVVFETADYQTGLVTVEGKILTENVTAGAQASNSDIHYNVWVGFCLLSRAQFDAQGEAVERFRQGWNVTLLKNGAVVPASEWMPR